MLLVMQFLGGLATGCFIPLTLGFILTTTPPKYWAFGIALYALHLELSLNISASLEGWYVDHLSWRWIFWQNVPLALLMSVCLRYGIAVKPIKTRPHFDLFALSAGGIGFALIYAALDQGNRLDWLNSGLVWGLLLAGLVLLAGFFVHERRAPQPLLNLKVAFESSMRSQFLLIGFLRLTILATGFLIPLYLGGVRGYRALEVGDTLIWIAVPQLLFCPLAALMLRRIDPRLVASIGFILICVACLMVGYQLTPLWGSTEFLSSQLLQALGQSFALSGVIFFGVLHTRPEDAFTFGAVLQTARLMGGEAGNAFIQTLARIRGQVASNLIGQHVQVGDPAVIERVQAYGAATTRVLDPEGAINRGQLDPGQCGACSRNDSGGRRQFRDPRGHDGHCAGSARIPPRGPGRTRIRTAAFSVEAALAMTIGAKLMLLGALSLLGSLPGRSALPRSGSTQGAATRRLYRWMLNSECGLAAQRLVATLPRSAAERIDCRSTSRQSGSCRRRGKPQRRKGHTIRCAGAKSSIHADFCRWRLRA